MALSDEVRPVISAVSLSRPFINPSLNQSVTISFEVDRAGALDVRILDRDGFVVRTLVLAQPRAKGRVALDWDGRDDSGNVVADDAYSLKIDLRGDGRTSSYFPAGAALGQTQSQTTFYDRQQGTFGYRLAAPSRIHLQAGSARVDPKTKEHVGPCLKTIVNREPRTAGSVVEYWDGYDESGTIYIPDLPDFAVSLVATALPDNAIITVGNRSVSFLEQASRRSGQSLLTARAASHRRHEGLSSFEDVAPRLTLRPAPATWLADQRLWSVARPNLELSVSLEGPSARVFEREPGSVVVFLDDDPIRTVEARPAPLTLSVQIPEMTARPHRLTVNWISDGGPVAANSVLISRGTAGRGTGHGAIATQPGGRP